jgi:Type II secretion system (T2SS), protein K
MVDRRSEADHGGASPSWHGGALVLLEKGRFVVAAVVALAAVALGFVAGESRDVAPGRFRELRLDPNTVPPQVLTALPHVGSSLVDRWVKAREERPFRSLEDARARVRGLGAATIGQITPYFEFPEGGGLEASRPARQKTVRAAAKRRTVRRPQSAPGKAEAVGQPRLAATLAPVGDR